MYARPKPGETEEDLLQMQEEFFKNKADNKVKPAAKLVSTNTNIVENKSNEEKIQVNIQEQLANTFEAIPSNINIGRIVEKRSEILDKSKNIEIKFSANKGFPQAKRRDQKKKTIQPTASSKGGSIFSQQIKKCKIEVDPTNQNDPMEIDNLPSTSSQPEKQKISIDLPSKSYILSGQDSQQIHKENLNILKKMSPKEIEEEREKLISTLDPALIAFLKSRRKEKVQTRNLTIREQNEAADNLQLDEIETPKTILNQPESERWLNFDVIETNKLAWMKDVDCPKKIAEKHKEFEARFDFDGWLLPYTEAEITEKNRVLYHHGEEPERPGYTLQELFQLARSTVIQQKIVALNCIANILSLNSSGVYDEIIDIPIEQIFFVLRFCLDDNTPSVLNAAIKALRNLIYFQIDEILLDNLLGFGLGKIQPTLAVDEETEDDNTVNDQQLVEKNLIRCLARTDILIRIRYILNTVKPGTETVVYCMEILIRMARDSQFIMTKVFNCPGLIESVVKHFVPKLLENTNSSSYGLPLLQAVKLLRILASRSKHIASELIKKFKVMESIVNYLTDETFSSNANGLKLQIESFHFWNVLIVYGLGTEYFYVLEPTLMRMLDYHFKNTNLDLVTTFVRQGHVAALLTFLAQLSASKPSLIQNFLSILLDNLLPKWCSQFKLINSCSCGKLQIIASLIYCCTMIKRHTEFDNWIKIDDTLINILDSEAFSCITENITNASMFLNNYETHKTSPNLKSLEGAAWHTMDHIVPLMQTQSCLPFLTTFSFYIQSSNNNQLKMKFLNHPNINSYLIKLKNFDYFHLTNNWFSRPESTFIMNILKTSVDLRTSLDTGLFYEIAVKCLCVFNADQKQDIQYLLENIVFCTQFYPNEALLRNLNITEGVENVRVGLDNLDEILQVYTNVLGLKNLPNFSTNLCLDCSLGNVIPIDWIYTPILVFYSTSIKVDEAQQIFTVKNCLRWILIYESYFPSLASSINATDKFCRLSCVFLASDNLFLNQEIHELLNLCYKNLVAFEKRINFSKPIQGLTNFQDFYLQLLEQYQGVSYGDILFGNVILFPLGQQHNVQFKKTLWSEYMGAVQVFNVTPDQTIWTKSQFLEPAEDDMSVLKSYRRAIVNNFVRKTSILYEIAQHHVDSYIKNKK